MVCSSPNQVSPNHVSPNSRFTQTTLTIEFQPPKKFFKLGETLFYLKLGETLCVKRDWVKRNWAKRDWVKRDWVKRNWVKRNWVNRDWGKRYCANCYHTLFSSYHH